MYKKKKKNDPPALFLFYFYLFISGPPSHAFVRFEDNKPTK